MKDLLFQESLMTNTFGKLMIILIMLLVALIYIEDSMMIKINEWKYKRRCK